MNKIDYYLMANFWQNSTGLSMIIWVTLKQEPIHVPWIMVQQNYLKKWTNDTVKINIETFKITGTWKLNPEDFNAVKKWIGLNKELIQFYWDEKIDTEMFAFQKKKV